MDEWPLCKEEFPTVWDGSQTPPLRMVENTCEGRTESGPGGGIRCPICGEWFCY